MHEHIAPAVYFVEVHLLYSSIVCCAAWAVTSLQTGRATWRYWVWVATALNFIVPFAGFMDRFGATRIVWATQLRGLDDIGIGVSRHPALASLLLGVWLSGATYMAARLILRIVRDRPRAAAGTESLHRLGEYGVPIRASSAGEGPCVGGLFRAHISLPHDIERLLSETELEAVLVHEVTHAKRRDNLIGLLYEVALCGLWFHPLMWLTGVRLATYRELSCDDSVIARSRGRDLVRALAKLAVPGEPNPLRAGAASLVGQRVARLMSSEPPKQDPTVDWLLIAAFAGVLLACIVGTIAHYPSCFKVGLDVTSVSVLQ
jgi:beta-lactamase regulating signal transducer with metallopeptidase domain